MAWFLVIALYVASTYVAGVVAEQRGRNVRTWYWMGALFGPPALLAVWLLPSGKEAASSLDGA
jgi:hypothetical protein